MPASMAVRMILMLSCLVLVDADVVAAHADDRHLFAGLAQLAVAHVAAHYVLGRSVVGHAGVAAKASTRPNRPLAARGKPRPPSPLS